MGRPPMVFDNPVANVQQFLNVMRECGTHPEFEWFDAGILRSEAMVLKAGMFDGLAEVNFVMGVANGMACDADLLPLLPRYAPVGALWQTTRIGRSEFRPAHQKTADLGGSLRTGLEDTFYRPVGERVTANGVLIEALAACARRAGRDIALPAEARQRLGLHTAASAATTAIATTTA